MSDDATPLNSGPEGPDSRSRSHRLRVRVAALAAAVVLVLAGGGWWLWHEDHTFCHEVGNLPDIAASVNRTGSPADGLISYADQLDQVASEAPDAQTAEAARTVASAQRAAGQTMQGEPVGPTAASVVAATPDTSLSAARQQLQQSIALHCPR